MSRRHSHVHSAFEGDELDLLLEDADDEKLGWADLLELSYAVTSVLGLCGAVHALFA